MIVVATGVPTAGAERRPIVDGATVAIDVGIFDQIDGLALAGNAAVERLIEVVDRREVGRSDVEQNIEFAEIAGRLRLCAEPADAAGNRSATRRRQRAAPAPPEFAGRRRWRNVRHRSPTDYESRCGKPSGPGRRCRKSRSPCRSDRRVLTVKPCWVSQLVTVAMSDAAGPNCAPNVACGEPMVDSSATSDRAIDRSALANACSCAAGRRNCSMQVRQRHGVVDAAAVVGGILRFRARVAGEREQVAVIDRCVISGCARPPAVCAKAGGHDANPSAPTASATPAMPRRSASATCAGSRISIAKALHDHRRHPGRWRD